MLVFGSAHSYLRFPFQELVLGLSDEILNVEDTRLLPPNYQTVQVDTVLD
jgi:hypothetical protein